MRRKRRTSGRIVLVGYFFFFYSAVLPPGAFPAMNKEFLEHFESPSAWYHTAPLWVWNDDITEEEIAQQLQMFRSQAILQPFVHPRPGLITPYLSDRWLDLYTFAVEEAKKLGMLINIYDENSYPSGFAGGHVPARHPEWVGKGISFEKADSLPHPLPENVLAVYRVENGKYRYLEENERDNVHGPVALLQLHLTPPRAWNGGYPYVDLLEPGLTEEFLRITYEPYRKRFGSEFGTTVRGAFTDEPHLRPAGKVHWNPHLPELFEKRYGYPLLEVIPALFEDTGDYRKVRHDFYEFLLDEITERWSKPYHDYCEKHGLLYTGHFWEHGWPSPDYGPDTMAMYAWQQMPGIDCLMNRYSEGVHAQFGNVRAVRELGSVANQMGRKRRLCEVYGAGGWEMSFEDQKRIADWLGVLGVNFFDQHLSYMTIRGARKRDHPLSFSDHEPWWPHYHLLGNYLARLAYVLSQGKEENRVLVLEPTTSAWLVSRAQRDNTPREALGNDFQKFLVELSLNQVEYDLGSERILRDHGSVRGKQLAVGECLYDLVVLHRTCSNLERSTLELLEDFRSSGGKILFVGGKPTFVNGRSDFTLEKIFPFAVSEAQSLLVTDSGSPEKKLNGLDETVAFLHETYARASFPLHEGGKLFHQYRRLEDGGILFLCNTHREESAKGTFEAEGGGVLLLDAVTGESRRIPFEKNGEKIRVSFDLPPAGSRIYLLDNTETDPPPAKKPFKEAVACLTLKGVKRTSPNVLAIDYCDFQVGGKREKSIYFYSAQNQIYQAHGFPEGNPWDSAVQFESRVLDRDKEFDESTGFIVRYRFVVEGFDSPPDLDVVVEQPGRYRITLNGSPVEPSGEWWLDRKFGRLSGKGLIRSGTNELILTARPFSVHHEVEPVYVLGDFSLDPRGKGWTIVPECDLSYGPWKSQGLPLYPAAVSYEYELDVPGGKNLYLFRLGDWRGTVASVRLDGEQVGLIAWPPYELELGSLSEGKHTLAVEVFGSLKNLLGPHHAGPQLGAAWPSLFRKAPLHGPPPGDEYDTIPYGLLEPPRLIERVSE